MTFRSGVIGIALIGMTAAAAALPQEMPFPEGFRTWTHVRSAVIGPDSPAYARFGGIHSIYANPAAMEGYRAGKFPDGSVLVFDNHDTLLFQGTTLPGKRRFVDVMRKDGGSWRFSEFNADSKTIRNVTVAQGEPQCGACHSRAPTDHVYSQFIASPM